MSDKPSGKKMDTSYVKIPMGTYKLGIAGIDPYQQGLNRFSRNRAIKSSVADKFAMDMKKYASFFYVKTVKES